MRKLLFVVIVSSVLFMLSIEAVKAESVSESTNTEAQVIKPQNIGNKICPVTGEKIDEKTKVTYEYKGKIYNFCCPVCIDEFKKYPDKYIKKVDEELNGQVQAKSKDHVKMP